MSKKKLKLGDIVELTPKARATHDADIDLDFAYAAVSSITNGGKRIGVERPLHGYREWNEADLKHWRVPRDEVQA